MVPHIETSGSGLFHYGVFTTHQRSSLGGVYDGCSACLPPRSLLCFPAAIKVARKTVGGGAYASSEMEDNADMLGETYDPSADLAPGVVGSRHCAILFPRSKGSRVISEK